MLFFFPAIRYPRRMIRPRIPSVFRLALMVAFAGVALAQPSAAPPPAAVISADNPKSFDPATATTAWLNTVPPDKRAKSDAYSEGGYWLILWNFLLTAAIALILLNSRTSVRLRDFAERRSQSKTWQVAIYTIGFSMLTYGLAFPLTVYQQFFREHVYEMATQNFGQWFGEQMLALFLQTILLLIALIALYATFRRAPRTWWLWASSMSIFLLSILFVISPLFIEPLFNTYKPLNDPAVRDPILAMARANEIPVTQVFEVDASRQTKRISANVAGFLGTTRIALNDNLLKQCTLPEIREVMGHEMGHYVLNHTTELIVGLGALLLIGFGTARAIFDVAIKRWGNSWGVRDISDPAGLPLLMLIFATVLFLLTPITNTITRVIEREADAFGINTSREADGSAMVALKLGQYRKLDPGPIEEFIFFDHPERPRARTHGYGLEGGAVAVWRCRSCASCTAVRIL